MIENDKNVEEYTDHIVNSIIFLENQLNIIEKEKNELYYEQEKEAYYIENDIEKLKKRITLLNELKRGDTISIQEELENKEIIKFNISNELSKVQKEYTDLKIKLQKSRKSFPIYNISSIDSNPSIKEIERIKKKIDKQENLIKEFDRNKKVFEEHLSMLKEEKRSTLLSVQNITSKTETLQEMLGNHNLIDSILTDKSFSQDNKLNKTIDFLEKNLECYNYEIVILDKEKITTELVNYLKQFFKFNEDSFRNICDLNISIIINNKSLNSDDFYNLFTKKLFDLLKISNKKKYLDLDVFNS